MWGPSSSRAPVALAITGLHPGSTPPPCILWALILRALLRNPAPACQPPSWSPLPGNRACSRQPSINYLLTKCTLLWKVAWVGGKVCVYVCMHVSLCVHACERVLCACVCTYMCVGVCAHLLSNPLVWPSRGLHTEEIGKHLITQELAYLIYPGNPMASGMNVKILSMKKVPTS